MDNLSKDTLKKTTKFMKSNTIYFKGIIIFLILFNKQVPNQYLQVLQSTLGKILFAVTIVLLLYIDPGIAMLLTVYYLFIMNEYNDRFKKKVDQFLSVHNKFKTIKEEFNDLNQSNPNNQSNQSNQSNLNNIGNKDNTNNTNNKNNKNNYKNEVSFYYNHPSDLTLTNNLFEDITQEQLVDIILI